VTRCWSPCLSQTFYIGMQPGIVLRAFRLMFAPRSCVYVPHTLSRSTLPYVPRACVRSALPYVPRACVRSALPYVPHTSVLYNSVRSTYLCMFSVSTCAYLSRLLLRSIRMFTFHMFLRSLYTCVPTHISVCPVRLFPTCTRTAVLYTHACVRNACVL
jgi:hypothetical protein